MLLQVKNIDTEWQCQVLLFYNQESLPSERRMDGPLLREPEREKEALVSELCTVRVIGCGITV